MSSYVLVVDDDAEIRGFVHQFLESEGYDVATAENGRSALGCITQHSPDLVLLDLNMPVMDGWTLFTELRQRHIDVPVVFVSAGERVFAEAEKCGANGALPKPFDLDDLLRIVAQVTMSDSSRG